MQRDFPINTVLRELEADDLLPAIVFRTSRSQCDNDVQRLGSNKRYFLDKSHQKKLQVAIKDIVARYDMDFELISTHQHYRALLLTGVGAHHAGQLLVWRLMLEELMSAGLLRVLIATGTVAAGVDFPARSVVITAHTRRGSEGFQTLSSSEFQQMSGRAGRRGKDAVGFCVIAPSMFCDARSLLKVAKRPPEPLKSAYFPSPSSVLNLLRYRNVDDLRFTVARSLASFVDKREAGDILAEARKIESDNKALFSKSDGEEFTKEEKRIRKKVRRLVRKADELRSRQETLVEMSLSGLESLGYVDGASLSEKGYWAAMLCTGVVLELSEILESGLFEGASADRLAAIVGSFAGDFHRKYLDPREDVLGGDVHERIESIIKKVQGTNIPGLQEIGGVSQSGAYTVLVWLKSQDWKEFRGLLNLSGVAEGDAARLITQTADHLNQLTRLSESHPKIAFRAEEAKRRLLRPPLTEAIEV